MTDLSEETFRRFVDLIYAAAEHPEHWHDVYEQLQAALGVRSVHVLAIDKDHGTLSYSDGANMPTEGELAYMHHYRLADPRLPMLAECAVGQWMHFPDVLDPAIPAEHPLYQEFLIPYDRRYSSACKLVDRPEATVIFSVLSGEAEGPLRDEARDFADRLLPHLQRACRLGIRNFVYSTQALVGHLLVDKMRQPVVLMSPSGEVMHTNAAARDLLQSTRLVQVVDDKLHLPPSQLANLLQRCRDLEQAAKESPDPQSAASAASKFRSLKVGDERDGESVYAFYALLSPHREMGAFGMRPIVMVLFYHPRSAPAIDASLLFAVFGLTPAECRVAQLLSEGLSVKEIATAQGRQLDTVRKQLRSIYQKTSTNRQPELIRLLLNLPHNAMHDASA